MSFSTKKVDTKSSQCYYRTVLYERRPYMYFASGVIVISIISVLRVGRLVKGGLVL